MWKKGMGKSQAFFLGFVSALVLALLIGGAWLMMDTLDEIEKTRQSGQPADHALTPVMAQQDVELILKKTFVCGTEMEERLSQTVPSTEQVFLDYQDWELISQQGTTFTFKKYIHDLAPICREKGYFGLNDAGVLTLFEGLPEEGKVIQTFFQINTEKLESGLLKHDLELLKKGIRIQDLAEYNSILSTYGEYAGGSSQETHSMGE